MNNILLNFDSENPHLHYSNITGADVSYYMVNNGLSSKNDIREFVDMECAGGKNPQYFEFCRKVTTGKLFLDIFTWAMNDPNVKLFGYSESRNDTSHFIKTGIELLNQQKCVAYGKSHEEGTPFDFNGSSVHSTSYIEAPFVMNMDVFRQVTRSIEVFNIVEKAMHNSFNESKDADFKFFFSEYSRAISPVTRPHAPLLGFK